MKIIAVSNQKGGVGKTTTAVNVAAALSTMKKKVLLVDIDPQSNATSGCGIAKYSLAFSMNEVLLGESTARQSLIRPASMQFDLLPSDASLTNAEIKLISMPDREYRLKKILESLASDMYDIVIMDCPPALNILTINALVAADSVLIPVQCEYYSLEGLSGLISTIEKIKEVHNPDLKIAGVLRTMYDPRSRLSRDVANQLFKHFGAEIMKCTIPRTIRLAEAPSHGVSIVDYDNRSSGSIAYMAMTNELLMRNVL